MLDEDTDWIHASGIWHPESGPKGTELNRNLIEYGGRNV